MWATPRIQCASPPPVFLPVVCPDAGVQRRQPHRSLSAVVQLFVFFKLR